MLCIVIRSHGKVRHWHWPRADIVNCENSKPDQDQEES